MSSVATPEDLAVVNEPVTYVREVNGIVRGVVLLPLTNVSGTPLGVIVATADFSGSRAAADRTFIWQAAFAGIAILLLAGVVVTILRGFITRPLQVLSEGFEKVSNGDTLTEIGGADRFPDEMRPIAQFYDKVRAHRLANAPK